MDCLYLDNNATTQPAPEVLEAMLQALQDVWANPSSIHRPGQQARRRVELARQSVAQLINCAERDVIFTSGGTEAVNCAVFGSVHAQPDRRVFVTTRLEHSAVRESAKRLEHEGFEIVWLPNDQEGRVDVAALEDVLRTRGAQIALVSIMWCNNETGTIQPIERIGAQCQEFGVRFHVDGTQWVGKMPTDVARTPVDLLTFAPHKFHGPKGAGAVYARSKTRVLPYIMGGPQERQRRGGTENVPGIIGFGAACDLARQWLATGERERLQALRDRFERRLLAEFPGAAINSGAAPRMWNTTNIAFPGVDTEAVLLLLSEKGVCASGGSACASGSLDPSPVLKAMNLPPQRISGSVRFSISRFTTDGEIDRALDIITSAVSRLQKSMAAVGARS